MAKEKIVVVMGGPSSESKVSHRSGTAVLNALRAKGHDAVPLELDPPHFVEDLKKLAPTFVFNALHGKFGEDGVLQGTLDMLSIPYTGSDVAAAAVTMDKVMTKRVFLGAGVQTPPALSFHRREREEAIKAALAMKKLPLVVKASSQGSSIGVTIAETEAELQAAIDDAFRYDEQILIEEFIDGVELTVAVWGDEKGLEAFPVIEITTPSGRYDFASKYNKGGSKHIIPARISEAATKASQKLAIDAYRACNCRGLARVDIMLAKDEQPYAIEVNSVPGLTELSLVPDAGRAMGVEFPDLCEKMLHLAGYQKE